MHTHRSMQSPSLPSESNSWVDVLTLNHVAKPGAKRHGKSFSAQRFPSNRKNMVMLRNVHYVMLSDDTTFNHPVNGIPIQLDLSPNWKGPNATHKYAGRLRRAHALMHHTLPRVTHGAGHHATAALSLVPIRGSF